MTSRQSLEPCVFVPIKGGTPKIYIFSRAALFGLIICIQMCRRLKIKNAETRIAPHPKLNIIFKIIKINKYGVRGWDPPPHSYIMIPKHF